MFVAKQPPEDFFFCIVTLMDQDLILLRSSVTMTQENDEDYGTIEGNLFGNQFTDGFDDDSGLDDDSD